MKITYEKSNATPIADCKPGSLYRLEGGSTPLFCIFTSNGERFFYMSTGGSKELSPSDTLYELDAELVIKGDL